MIQLCNRAVLILKEDGSTDFFQSDDLQEKLESSCRATGLNETWIAEDLALSVEFALGEMGSDKIFTDLEIDAIVIKVLHEAGLGVVATDYSNHQDNPEAEVSFNLETIAEIIDRYLHLEGDKMKNVAIKVSDAGKKLLLKNASPTLILELAKHYIDDKSSIPTTLRHQSLYNQLHSCPWLISKEAILQKISGDTAKMVSNQIIKVSGISRLFPSIRVEITFAKFAEEAGLIAPVTDFIMLSYLANLAIAVDDIINIASEIIYQQSEKLDNLPVYLKFIDAPEFTEKWLNGNWEESKTCFEELVLELKTLLKNEVFSYS